MDDELTALLAHLDAHPATSARRWQGWRIRPVGGGANNLLYRATGRLGDYAIKFAVRDERDRAGREHAALSAIAQAGADFAPRAVLLAREGYRQPAVIQTWVEGPVAAGPPATGAEWVRLLDLYSDIHRVTPDRVAIDLPAAVLNVASGEAGRQLIFEHLARIPAAERPRSLQPLADWLERWEPPEWDAPPRALCRVDGNWRNFVQRADRWVAVDWENSGWGDPAFEWADLITHPAYAGVPPERWGPPIAAYARRMGDPGASERVATYSTIMWLWWVVRWARYLYEVPRGLDPRLAARPATWQADATRSYERYLARAKEQIGLRDSQGQSD
jgi:hypothetical protein